jgi:trimeric autotransporter adhesin
VNVARTIAHGRRSGRSTEAQAVAEPSLKTNFAIRISLCVLVLLSALMPSPMQAQAQNIINTIAGGGPTPADPLQADIPGPTGIIKNAAGDLLIAPPFSSYIYKLSAGGVFSVYSGKGYGGFSGDGGPVGQARLGYPSGFAFDSKGNLYITDFGNSRVRKVDAVTAIITTVAGTGEKCAHPTNPCGDGGPATAALLNLPEAVAVDSAFNIYIADSSDNRIRKVDGSTGIITTVAGDGNACANPTLACGDGGPATSANLNFPQGVTVDGSGNIYVSDTADNRVRIVSAGVINRYAGNGGACLDPTKACGDGGLATNANLHAPQGVALDSSGNGYIADSRDHRVRQVNALTLKISTFAGTGVQGFSGDGGPAKSAELDLPGFVYPDSTGNIDIADTGNQRIRQVNPAGTINTIVGGASGGDQGPALNATLAGPYTLTEDSSGNVYFADLYNNRIRRIANDANRTITTVAGTGSAGYSGDGGPGTLAMLNAPSSVAFDAQGNLYIADENNLRVRKLDLAGNISTVAGNGSSCTPTTASCGDGGPATSATMASPQTVVVDASGNVYIADYFAHRIRKVDTSGTITTLAGTGVAGNKGDGGPANQATLNHPSGVTVDSVGNVYISDQYNNRIRQVRTDNNIYAFALNGQAHLGGDGGPAINGSMWNPLEITIDPAGNLFVSGGNDRTVQIIDAATQYWGTVAGSSKKASVGDFSGDGGPAQSARLANAGSSVDGQGNLYIADQGNNRVRYVLLAPAISNTPASLAFGNVPLNQTSAPQTVTTLSSGGLDLNLTSVSITGTNASNFAVSSNTCPAGPLMMAPNRKCAESVTFTPTNYGKQTATLSFTDSATGSPQSVSLSGSGPDFTIAASPTSLTITKGSSGSSTITLAPLAQFNQTIKLTVTGCPANTTCTVTPSSVTLDGTNNGTATLNIQTTSSTASGTYTITVKGAFTPLQHPVSITLTVP